MDLVDKKPKLVGIRAYFPKFMVVRSVTAEEGNMEFIEMLLKDVSYTVIDVGTGEFIMDVDGQTATEGDYIVRNGDEVFVMSPNDFKRNYY